MKKYILLWITTLILLSYEYYCLNFVPQKSIFLLLQHKKFISQDLELNTQPGRLLSLIWGWLGLGLMIIMNAYSMRKRFNFLQNAGKLSDWLNFHIFCGLLGPSFIFFHSNFKVRGLVSISFWSMVISFSSGIIGRYFYVQILKEKKYFESIADQRAEQLIKYLQQSKIEVQEADLVKIKNSALEFVGVLDFRTETLNPFTALLRSLMGDIKLLFKDPTIPANWPKPCAYILTEFALHKRKALFLSPFQKLMGYWHNFHFPFAVFMYVVAIIHVAVALLLGV